MRDGWHGVRAALSEPNYHNFTIANANQTVIQLAVADHLRGRLRALRSMIFRSAPALGALAIGTLSDLTGLRWPLAAGAAMTAPSSGIVYAQRMMILKSLDL